MASGSRGEQAPLPVWGRRDGAANTSAEPFRRARYRRGARRAMRPAPRGAGPCGYAGSDARRVAGRESDGSSDDPVRWAPEGETLKSEGRAPEHPASSAVRGALDGVGISGPGACAGFWSVGRGGEDIGGTGSQRGMAEGGRRPRRPGRGAPGRADMSGSEAGTVAGRATEGSGGDPDWTDGPIPPPEEAEMLKGGGPGVRVIRHRRGCERY